YTTIGGIRAGALVAAASIALTLVAEAMSPSPLIDAYTLVLFGAVMAVQAAILPAAVGELERIVDRSPDALLLVDADGRVRYASSEAERLLNADRGTLLGSPLEPTIDLTRSREVAVELPGGERRLVEPRVSTVSGPGGPLSVIGLRDVTDRVREEERFRELALRDELTGLYNRRGFLVLSEQHLKLASRTGTSPLVLYMDVVGLKGINDTWGHAEGDRALRAVGDALAETFRGSDVLARVGGDEFCALLWGPTEENVAIERLGDTLARRGSELRLKYKLQVAAGTARFDPLKPRSTHELMDAADRSMYAEGRRAGAR
ncbi:MAG TPA: diguanylate cyclase, partial [Actinomycetota bacterium]|nr:diguanylate cyclase [Actinomycetota bacterium]